MKRLGRVELTFVPFLLPSSLWLNPSSLVFLLHVAAEAPFAVHALWSPLSREFPGDVESFSSQTSEPEADLSFAFLSSPPVPILEITNSTIVFLKVSFYLSL